MGLCLLSDQKFLNLGVCSEVRLKMDYYFSIVRVPTLDKSSPCGSDTELSYSWLIMASGPQHPQRICHLDREPKGYGKV